MVAGRTGVPPRDLENVARRTVGQPAAATRTSTLGASLRADVTELTVSCLSMAVGVGDAPTTSDEDIAELGGRAAQWAREGVPLRAVLGVYHEGIQMGWDLVSERATGNLKSVAKAFVALSERISTAASASYVDELQAVASEHHTAAHTVVTALLSGHNARSVARQSGIELADSFTVLAVSIAAHPDESNPALPRAVTARRKLRRVQAELALVCDRSPLSMLSAEGGTILVPGERDDEWVATLVERMSVAAETAVTATVATSSVNDVPAASDQVHELLDLAQQLRRPAGVYRMTDLVLEYQLTRPGPGRAYLSRVLVPLDNSPELLETLEIHINHDLNRQRSARQLHLHTNTVDYRLKRIAHLTGFDPTRPSGMRHLQAALVARKLEAISPSA
ncbi:helix-turn-helix domain-containing protein [Rhodococcus sp. BP-349]|nr:helix-turn-helix domain-containing protein [Rhodococcus sp. BP-363]MBY6542606.1 helix-turn-helix domain-containing protein [Rhodococcus sp. BP-369]MBY6561836.1 helix-turn-helix domain-containing protein [Rhodococcus sp. BP-370]MBY6576128.1 helix-turn-helix domain-containing protein [Rhodococcus sp. BP-364]MBY6585429.1 helix-turn-helix domain-containing protein [Rhodococcus sp. BP-358]MBY6589766.1 helix-turn-helix domain-containing protein [Rhodococcus sp. BP-362]MBY6593701.1 helix-turn-hel